MRARAHYTIVKDTAEELIIRDDNDGAVSVTNDAEAVIADLTESGKIRMGKRLFYYDTDGQMDELCHNSGRFIGFVPGPERKKARA